MSIDIRSLDRQLSHLITKPTVGSKRRPSVALKLLERLRELPMTLELLVTTKVGITVNNVRKQKWSEEVTKLAAKLIKEWNELMPKKIRFVPKKSSNKTKTKKVETKTNEQNNEENTEEKSEDQNISIDSNVETNDGNKENEPKNANKSQPTLKKKKTFKNSNKGIEPKTKKFKKLAPIGQLPEYSAERLRQKRLEKQENERKEKILDTLSQPSTSTGITGGVGGHQLYEKIIRKRKLERTTKMDSPRKRAMTFATVAAERYRNDNSLSDKPRVQNLPVPYSVPIITPADRLKIIQTRNLETPPENAESSKPKVVAFKDEHEIELDTWRVRSAKSLTRIIPRVEHKPKYLSKK